MLVLTFNKDFFLQSGLLHSSTDSVLLVKKMAETFDIVDPEFDIHLLIISIFSTFLEIGNNSLPRIAFLKTIYHTNSTTTKKDKMQKQIF